ncbi:MAG TPA: DMT family transporter [Methylotenera sp.]|nr:DMT family transporter [Methylotenera sp.]
MKLPHLGSLWMLVAALGFAIMGALVKVGATKFSSAELVFYRSLFGLLAIYAYIFFKKLPLKTPVFAKHMSRALVGFVSLVLFFYAIAHLHLATAVTLNYTSPLFLALFMPFLLDEKPARILYAAVAIGFIGVVLLLKPTLHSNDALAGAMGLASGAGAAIAYINVKQLANLNEPDWRTVYYFTLVSTVASGAWLLLSHSFDQPGFTTLGWQDLSVLIGLGVSATIAQLAMTRAYRTGHTLTVASLAYLTVVLASFFGVLFWQEQLSGSEWLAIGLIILSGIISVNATNLPTKSQPIKS